MEIIIQDLVKSYGSNNALNKISFEIREGQFFTLAGANGAGKSTLIDILLHRIEANSGNVLVGGKEIMDHYLFKEVGVVFQNNVLDADLSVYQNILIRARMHFDKKKAIQETAYWLKRLMLDAVKKTQYAKLSGGERRKVDLVVALIGYPKLLIMDEPTTGIDVQSREQIWQCIEEISRERKMTILLTTHYLEEAERSDYMIILNKGNIVAQGSPYDLKQQYVRKSCYLYTDNPEALNEKLKREGIESTIEKAKVIIPFDDNRYCIELLRNYENEYQDFEVVLGSLEKVFMNIMKEEN